MRSFCSNRRATQARCSASLSAPKPSEPKSILPCLSKPRSFCPTPSMPAGGDALASAISSSAALFCHCFSSSNVTPPAPLARTVAPRRGRRRRRALTDRPGAARPDGAVAGGGAAGREPRHRRRGRRVGAIAVEHPRNSELRKELLAYRREHCLALGHVAAADEDGGVFLVLEAPGEDRPLDETAGVLGVDSAVCRNVIGASVVADDVIEDRGQGVRIELVEQFFH